MFTNNGKKLLTFACVLTLIIGLFSLGATAVEEEEKYGGTLTFPLPYGGSLETLDPMDSSQVMAWKIADDLGDGLLEFDYANLEPQPSIAKEWEIEENVYTFHLREGVQFAEGYGEVTAEDFLYTFKKALNPDKPTRSASLLFAIEGAEAYKNGEADEIKGINVLDPYTLEITLKSTTPSFVYTMCSPRFSVVPEEAVEEYGDRFGSNFVSAGPFKLVRWVRGNKVEVEANENYYRGRPYLDKIEYQVMPEPSARITAFKSGDLDFDIVTASMYSQYKENPEYEDQLIEVAELWTRLVDFNLRREKWQDVRVRKAFNYAIDKETLVKEFLGDKAVVATGFLPTPSPGFNPDLEGYEYDPEKARELMEEAGYSEDNPLEFTCVGLNDPSWGAQAAQALVPYLEEAHFDPNVEQIDGSTLWDRRSRAEFDTSIASTGLALVSPVEYLRNQYHGNLSAGEGNTGGYQNEEFDQLIDEASNTVDQEKRFELVHEAEKIMLDDAPSFFWNYNKAVGIQQPWVHGFVPSAKDMILQPLDQVWLDPDHQ